MPIPPPTLEELIATFNHSSLPVVVVEGGTEANLLRHLEDHIGVDGCLVPCGGRSTLFALIQNISRISNDRVAFLADQDAYCIEGGHIRHPRLLYTWGYSLENDVLAGSHVDQLIWRDEREKFDAICRLATKFFAFRYEIAKLRGEPIVWDVAIETIIDPHNATFRSTVGDRVEILAHESKLSEMLYRNFRRYMRGKQLVQLYLLILNRPKRSARFNTGSLLESCVVLAPNKKLRALARSIGKVLNVGSSAVNVS